MSVTFFLRSGETVYPSCESCGKSLHDPVYTDCEVEDCLGYGPDPVKSTPELNLSNLNARAFLRVLGIHNADLCGELDPTEIKKELALASMRVSTEVRAPQVEGNIITGALTEERLGTYCARLYTLATLAERRREPILYG